MPGKVCDRTPSCWATTKSVKAPWPSPTSREPRPHLKRSWRSSRPTTGQGWKASRRKRPRRGWNWCGWSGASSSRSKVLPWRRSFTKLAMEGDFKDHFVLEVSSPFLVAWRSDSWPWKGCVSQYHGARQVSSPTSQTCEQLQKSSRKKLLSRSSQLANFPPVRVLKKDLGFRS